MRWELEGGGSVLVETAREDVARGGWAPAGVGAGAIHEAKLRMDEALSHVRDVATTALKTFRELPVMPDEVEVEFGVKLASEAGAVIAKAKAEGQLVVRLRWQAPDRSG